MEYVEICIDFLWNLYRPCTEYEWYMYSICMEYVWSRYGICVEYVWNMYGICMKYVSSMNGICMEYLLNMYRVCLKYVRTCVRNGYGTYEGNLWNTCGAVCNMYGICIAYGICVGSRMSRQLLIGGCVTQPGISLALKAVRPTPGCQHVSLGNLSNLF